MKEQMIVSRKLFNAVEQNKLQKVKKYLDEGADVDVSDVNDKNNTPLHVTVLKGESDVIELF